MKLVSFETKARHAQRREREREKSKWYKMLKITKEHILCQKLNWNVINWKTKSI
jgi:hypothetical protein